MPVITKTPGGEDIVILSRPEFDQLAADAEDLADIRIAHEVMARVADGTEELLSGDEVDEYLAATTPMAFWRKRRGLTLAALSEQTGLTQELLFEIEAGTSAGDTSVLGKIGAALGVTQDQIIND